MINISYKSIKKSIAFASDLYTIKSLFNTRYVSPTSELYVDLDVDGEKFHLIWITIDEVYNTILQFITKNANTKNS